MRAKLVNEDLISASHGSEDMPIEDMAAEIASIVYVTYNGDDVDYEPNDEDTEEVEEIIKNTVDISKFYNTELYGDVSVDADIDEPEPLTEDGLDVFGDEEWILDQLSEEDIKKLYDVFSKSKYSNKSGMEDYGEHGEDSPEYWKGFDLDQEIYDRNPDYDVDEYGKGRMPKSLQNRDERKIKKHKHYFRGLDPNGGCIKCGKTRKQIVDEETV